MRALSVRCPSDMGRNLHTMTRDTLYVVISLAWLAVLAASFLYCESAWRLTRGQEDSGPIHIRRRPKQLSVQ